MGFGGPCIRCGECCKAEPCEIVQGATGQSKGVCQALVFNDGIASCLAYENADEDIKPFMRFRWGIGMGVCTNEIKEEATK